eukprot:TRINITY_DN16961_c0_g1_i2.p1 TRINITY_DN16961_c0_g1~~TRINITY_DN16961_c0_g1_i2.p1  ORF type:complete len:202 (-),score=20.01 TRINITY_DN16961_c0_g1_i2:45-650(-)
MCERLQSMGFTVLDEGFLDMPKASLHPQSLTMEAIWVSRWMSRLLERHQKMTESQRKETILITDRSPFSSILYAKRGGNLLDPLISEQLVDLRDMADIHVYTIHIHVDKKILWERIQERLRREPFRNTYNEGSHEWMLEAAHFYDSHPWDVTVENNNKLESALNDIMSFIDRRATKLKLNLRLPAPIQSTADTDSLPQMIF